MTSAIGDATQAEASRGDRAKSVEPRIRSDRSVAMGSNCGILANGCLSQRGYCLDSAKVASYNKRTMESAMRTF